MTIRDLRDLRIDETRFRANFEALAGVGATGDGGVHRPVFGEFHLAARRWFHKLASEAGFEFNIDPAGNHSAILPCVNAGAGTLLLGSHLDSVPFGGRFDGALGVFAVYEVLNTIRDANLVLPINLEVIDFTDEEGTLIGLLGSRAVAGILSEGEILNPRGGAEQLRDALAAASLKPSQLLDAYREPEALVGFLEVHIEQGPKLIASSADIGVVQSLVGIGSLGVTFVGRADHAGTIPMDARLDAGVGAANFLLAARQMVLDQFPNCVANVGQIVFGPGVMNIVSSTAKLGVEYRSPNQKQMVALKDALEGVAERIAEENDLRLEWEDLGAIAPTRCDQSIQDAFREACERLGLESIDLHSGAGHDTMAMAAICPAGMIFIPSTGGSHSAREHAEWGACVQGANVLLQSVMGLADRYVALDT